jgi:hypothetical protein
MSEAVTVAGGTPTLTLNNGGTATYTRGSGTSALTFSYTVGAGQNTTDLAVTGLNGNTATVTDAAGNTADLSLNGLIQSGPQINTAAPAAPVIAHDSVHGNHVALTGTAEAHNTVSVYDGQTLLGSTTANAAGNWSYTTGQLTTGAHTFVATATDASGNTSSYSSPLDPFIGATSHTDKLTLTGATKTSTVHANANAATLDDIFFGTSSKSDAQPSALSLKNQHHASTTSDASAPVSDSTDPHTSVDHGSVHMSASEIAPMAATDTSTVPQWQIDISKLRDMIGSLENAHKNILSSDPHSSDSSAAGFVHSGPDGFSFKSDLTEEISKHPHSAADSAEITQQLDAVYAQLRAEFQTANADSTLTTTLDATTMSHDVGGHSHLHASHLM